MAVIVNGDGILTGVSSLTTALDDITSGRGTITGVTTVGTLQLGTGVSMSSPRSQQAAIFTNDTEFFTVDDAGRVGVGTITPNSDAHPQNVGKINVGFITARSIAGDIDANTMVVAGISTFVGAVDVNSTSNFGDNLTVSSGNLTMSGAGNIVLGDSSSGNNDRITFGASTDLEIFHNGTNNHIDCHTAGQELYIRPTKDVYFQDYVTDDVLIKMVKDGAVELYYDDTKRFETTSSGADVTGRLHTDGVFIGDGGNNDVSLSIGANNDLRLYHDSNHSYIMDRGTGSLIIDSDSQVIFTTPTFTVNNAANSETMITASEDGAVKLYHDHGQRLETFDLGIDIGTSATGNFGIRWGGSSYNYANIWTEYGSGDIFIAGGLKQKGTNGGFFSSYGGNFSRNAIQVNAYGNSGIQFYASAAQNVAKDDAITVNEIARVNQHGLTFNGDTSASNALDDYEEGTWTPSIHNGGSPSYSQQSGLYTKIGNLVRHTFYMGFTGASLTSSSRIQGLPFAYNSTFETSTNLGRIGSAWNDAESAGSRPAHAIGHTGSGISMIYVDIMTSGTDKIIRGSFEMRVP